MHLSNRPTVMNSENGTAYNTGVNTKRKRWFNFSKCFSYAILAAIFVKCIHFSRPTVLGFEPVFTTLNLI